MELLIDEHKIWDALFSKKKNHNFHSMLVVSSVYDDIMCLKIPYFYDVSFLGYICSHLSSTYILLALVASA